MNVHFSAVVDQLCKPSNVAKEFLDDQVRYVAGIFGWSMQTTRTVLIATVVPLTGALATAILCSLFWLIFLLCCVSRSRRSRHLRPKVNPDKSQTEQTLVSETRSGLDVFDLGERYDVQGTMKPKLREMRRQVS